VPANATYSLYAATSYNNPRVASGTVPILDAAGRELGTVSGRGFVDAAMEGTAVLPDGTQVTVDRFITPPDPAAYADAVAAARNRYYSVNRRGVALSPRNVGLAIAGRTANRDVVPASDAVTQVLAFRVTRAAQGAGGTLVPFRSVAVPRGVAMGTRMHIRELEGRRLPDGTTHDGWVTAADRGGNITAGRLDFYTGDNQTEVLGGDVHVYIP
jgi:3D (Asp-Asp-Asp) domain-containing protein